MTNAVVHLAGVRLAYLSALPSRAWLSLSRKSVFALARERSVVASVRARANPGGLFLPSITTTQGLEANQTVQISDNDDLDVSER